MRSTFPSLNVPAGVGAGQPFNCSSMEGMVLQTSGVTSTVANIQGSLDGETWETIVTGAANGLATLTPALLQFIRVQVTSRGGDTPVFILGGRDSRTK